MPSHATYEELSKNMLEMNRRRIMLTKSQLQGRNPAINQRRLTMNNTY